jgi:RHS repeat-associated protein
MRCRTLPFLLYLCLSGLAVLGQSYQSSFSEVRFDRAKGPATFAAGVEVDAASGAASLSIPFGPGIGARGLRFRPLLSMRMAPQMGISTHEEYSVRMEGWPPDQLFIDTLYQRGFGSASFSPGTLDLGTLVSTVDRKKTSYSLPGGEGGRVLGQLPAGVSVATVQSLLTKFGFAATDTVGYLPGPTTVPLGSRSAALQMGSTGHLVVGLRSAGPVDAVTGLTDEVSDDIQEYPTTIYRWHFPRRMVVLQEEVAYEYRYADHSYLTHTIPYLAISEKTQLYSGHYMLVKIRNKLGESIGFTYDADGIGYTATWSANPAVKIRVQAVGTVSIPSGNPALLNAGIPVQSATQIRVSYLGISQPVSSFLLEVADPQRGAELLVTAPWNAPDLLIGPRPQGTRASDMVSFGSSVQSLQPLRVVQEGTQEEVRFSYGAAQPVGWGSQLLAPTVLNSVTFPTRKVGLVWEPYRFRMNYSPESWGGSMSSTLPGRPAFAYGVVRIDDSDGTQLRQTRHSRAIPTSNWVSEPGAMSTQDQWVNTSFYDAITHPDGSVSVHRFVSPPTSNGVAGADGMQNLAYIKTLEWEARYYLPGTDWTADLAVNNPASSSAYKWVVKDRFDVRTIGAPTGDLTHQSVPYPTRVRTWDKESQVLSIEETTDWDGSAGSWRASHTTTSITGAPSLTMDYLSREQQGQGYAAYPATQGLYRRVDKTFEPKAADWIFARVKTEQSTTVEDNTGFRAAGVTVPDVQPLLTKTFHTDLNRVEAVAVSNAGAPTVTTAFAYQGTTGRSSQELLNAYLQAPGLGLSGLLGVSAYGYDANGYLSTIKQKPNAGTTLTVSQASDELGRPMSQTDPNGTVKSFIWDLAGRLAGISSSDNDVSTTIGYDADQRGITVTRGAQLSGYRYNGFGQLILERRRGQDGQWSHRLYGYDAAGRPTGESVWLAGDGATRETLWTLPNLTRQMDITTTNPGSTICKRWGLDPDGNAVCLIWQTIPGSTTTTSVAAAYPGSAVGYDGRGRVTLTQDANLVRTTTEYFGPGNLPPGVGAYVGPIRKITTGTTTLQVKWFESDAGGRVVRATTPVTRNQALQNLRTEYRYDGGDRIKEVKQIDEAGRVQTRTWGYTQLGWLESLGQPESGTTTFSGFTVAGKPTITNYNGRIVRMTPDWMGRLLAITSDDGTVAQGMAYDTALNGQGRLASSTDRGVTTTYSYGGQGKRLDSLTTTVQVQGVPQAFTQTFSYDTYGNRTGSHTGHAGWTQSYHNATGLPDQLRLGAASVASTPWASYDPTGWMLRRVDYGNGTRSTFDYDADQTRLAQVTHSPASGGPLAQWAYTYDTVGNLVRENDVLTGTFDQYSYDELNRLISAIVQSPTYGEQLQQFDYDAFGNRISSNIVRVTGWSNGRGVVGSIAYTTASAVVGAPGRQVVNAAFSQGSAALLQNRLPATTSTGLPTGAVYDGQGNLLQVFEKPTTVNPVVISLTYDALGRVLSTASTRTGLSERYQYTVEGLRTLVEEYSGTTLVKSRISLYNDARQLVSQWDKSPTGALTWKRDILYLGTREAAEFDAAGMHVTQVDHLGSPRIITGPTGAVESRQKYLPFGELLEQTGAFTTAKGYTNHEQTDASGLIYMQARFYVPWFGRFASPDPARDQHFEETQSWNIYSYVRNNPIMSTDPTGMIGEGNKLTLGQSATQNLGDSIANEENKKKKEAQTNETDWNALRNMGIYAFTNFVAPTLQAYGKTGKLTPLAGGLIGLANDTYNVTTDKNFSIYHYDVNVFFDVVGLVPSPFTVGASMIYGAIDLYPNNGSFGLAQDYWNTSSAYYADHPPTSMYAHH